MSTQNNTPARPDNDKARVTYQVAGQDVTLSYQIVRSFLTKGNGNVSDQELTQFISICKYNQLNPFLNEAYLVKFGNSPASMIVSKEALMKRAESCKEYEGIQAGVILQTKEGEIKEVEGCFKRDNETLVGGWAKVYRSDRKFPIVARVNLDEYDKKQSTWNEKKSTMISKVAKVQALREAFPTQLGAMYTAEEQGTVQDVEFEEIKKAAKANKQEIFMPEPELRKPEQTPKPETVQLDTLKVKSLREAKDILVNEMGATETALTTEADIHAVAEASGFKIVIENTKGPGF